MADDVDLCAANVALETHATIQATAKRAAAIPPGEPGRCRECFENSPRLVGGRCAPCRDGAA